MKDEVITPEEKALGAFLSAMYDQRLDGTKMREAMLKVLGIAAPKAPKPSREVIERFMADKGFYLSKEAMDNLMAKLGESGYAPPVVQQAQEPVATVEHLSYATTVMALIEDYAKAVHDGDDNSCTVLLRTIKASLEQPPKALEPLTDKRIDELQEENKQFAEFVVAVGRRLAGRSDTGGTY